ncbi:hypothetical protein IDZ49_10100, partial [Francisella tularensis]|nr:hypothetical protein [Francisella tularensis]
MLLVLLLTFVMLFAVSIWRLASVVMFFKCPPRGILPEWLYKTNKYESPQNALVVMGILVTDIDILTPFLPSVHLMYKDSPEITSAAAISTTIHT